MKPQKEESRARVICGVVAIGLALMVLMIRPWQPMPKEWQDKSWKTMGHRAVNLRSTT